MAVKCIPSVGSLVWIEFEIEIQIFQSGQDAFIHKHSSPTFQMPLKSAHAKILSFFTVRTLIGTETAALAPIAIYN
jgi:hypothetical protein